MKKAIGVPLTEMQIKRQVGKIKQVLFKNYIEENDGDYTGELHPEVETLFTEFIKDKEDITSTEYLEIITGSAISLKEFLNNKLKGVDDRLLDLYCFDFCSQTMAIYYDLELSFDNMDKNIMHG